MNIHTRPPTTRESHPVEPARRRWTADELRLIDAAGVFGEGEHVELIAGEIIKMAPKGNHHELLRNELTLYWGDRRASLYKFAAAQPLRLGDNDEPEPDIILFQANQRVFDVRPDTVLLVVEIADSSLSYDLTIKAALYASFGVREFWVLDARSLMATVHRHPQDGKYTEVSELAAVETLIPLLAPEMAVRLADLDLAYDGA